MKPLSCAELENDPNAKWFFGRLTCDFIDDLWNEYDNRFEQGLPALPANPRPIVDPLRKEGLVREHPFVDALFKECLEEASAACRGGTEAIGIEPGEDRKPRDPQAPRRT